MSVRLNVVVVQSSQMSPLQVGVVAEIVIELLGRPGIDVAMVASLQPNEEQSTDRLMLSGIANDLAVVDWRSAEEILSSLSSLGLAVTRARHALDPHADAMIAGSRRVYLFDLRLGFRASEVVQTLTTLLEQRQVVTVSLSVPADKASHKTTVTPTANSPSASLPAAVMPSMVRVPLPANLKETTSRSNGSLPQRSHVLADDASLEALVDDLNDIDL